MIKQTQETLEKYLAYFPQERGLFEILEGQLTAKEDVLSRKNFNGHITASGLVMSPDGKVLVIFHNKLQRYLQPGGHIESVDTNLVDSARREVMEETGLRDLVLYPWCLETGLPISIDTHPIPENKNKNEAKHYHHDHMFVFYVQDETIALDLTEVSDFKWIDMDTLAHNDSALAKALRNLEMINIASK